MFVEGKITTDPSAVLFDLDGTLVDNSSKVVDCFMETARTMGYYHVEWTTFWNQKGKNCAESARAIGINEEDIVKFEEIYHQKLDSFISHTSLFPGAYELVHTLHTRGTPLAVVTTNKLRMANTLLSSTGMSKYFPVVIGEESVTNPKPDPEGIKIACKLLSVPLDTQVLFIGDSNTDMLAGNSAGVTTIQVNFESGALFDSAQFSFFRIAQLRDSLKLVLE